MNAWISDPVDPHNTQMGSGWEPSIDIPSSVGEIAVQVPDSRPGRKYNSHLWLLFPVRLQSWAARHGGYHQIDSIISSVMSESSSHPGCLGSMSLTATRHAKNADDDGGPP